MENILKILMTFVFLSLLVDAAVSIPLAHRHNHSTGEYAPASAAARSTLVLKWIFRGKGKPNVRPSGKAPPKPFLTPAPTKPFLTPKAPTKPIKPPKIPKDVEKSFNEAQSKFSEIGNVDLEKVFKDLSIKHKESLKHLSALDDCLLMTTDTIQLIQSSIETIDEFSISEDIPRGGVLLLQAHQLLSAAQTNVATCSDGFSHCRGDRTVQADLNSQQSDLMNLNSLVDNLMSIANELSDEEAKTVKAPLPSAERWMTGEEYWPEWLSNDDKNLLLEAKEVKGHFTVSKKGVGDFRTVSAAVAAAVHANKGGYSTRIVIRIKEGKYIENVVIPKDMKNLTFVGDGKERTLIVAAKNVVDGNTTFNSATVGVAGEGFLARDITFQNSAGPSKLQAVALRVNADRAVFYNCSMIGYQNTLYVHSFRQFYKDCYISGTVDFIFGNAAVVLHGCNIEALTPNPKQQNTVTAQGRNHPRQNTGIFILNSHITGKLDAEGNPTTYLGRPWGKYSRTVVVRTEILDGIYPAGWVAWDGQYALDTLFYAEYDNRGPGAGTDYRVEWGIQPLNEVLARRIVSEMGFNSR